MERLWVKERERDDDKENEEIFGISKILMLYCNILFLNIQNSTAFYVKET